LVAVWVWCCALVTNAINTTEQEINTAAVSSSGIDTVRPRYVGRIVKTQISWARSRAWRHTRFGPKTGGTGSQIFVHRFSNLVLPKICTRVSIRWTKRFFNEV
ncbi:unnamed protein product, partial [Pylaiella littoralis]